MGRSQASTSQDYFFSSQRVLNSLVIGLIRLQIFFAKIRHSSTFWSGRSAKDLTLSFIFLMLFSSILVTCESIFDPIFEMIGLIKIAATMTKTAMATTVATVL